MLWYKQNICICMYVFILKTTSWKYFMYNSYKWSHFENMYRAHYRLQVCVCACYCVFLYVSPCNPPLLSLYLTSCLVGDSLILRAHCTVVSVSAITRLSFIVMELPQTFSKQLKVGFRLFSSNCHCGCSAEY